MFGYWVFALSTYMVFSLLSEEPKTDISLPRDKLLRAKEIKERKKILRENHQNADMERAARLRTGLYLTTSLPAPATLGPQLPPASVSLSLQC